MPCLLNDHRVEALGFFKFIFEKRARVMDPATDRSPHVAAISIDTHDLRVVAYSLSSLAIRRSACFALFNSTSSQISFLIRASSRSC